jgi:hypothetical protein
MMAIRKMGEFGERLSAVVLDGPIQGLVRQDIGGDPLDRVQVSGSFADI